MSPENDNPAGLPTKAAIARHYQVSPTTVQNWSRHAAWPGIPTTVDQVDAFLARSRGTPRDGTDKADDPDREYRRHKARLQELKVLQIEGELVPASAAEAELREMALAVRKAILALPRVAAPRLAGITDAADIEAILAAEVDQVLSQLSGINTEGDAE